MAKNFFEEEILGKNKTNTVNFFKNEILNEVPIKTKDDRTSSIEEVGIFGKIFDVPGAAIRSALQGKGYVAGALNPSKVKKFQDIAIKKSQFTTSPVANAALGLIPSTVGLAADIATNPADLLLAIAGKTPTGGGTTLGGKIATSKAGQAIGRVATKQRRGPINWVKDILGGPRIALAESKTAIKEVTKVTGEKIALATKEGAKKKAGRVILDKKTKHVANIEKKKFSQSLAAAQEKNTGQIRSEAIKETKLIEDDLPKLFKKQSKLYGERKDALIGNKKLTVDSNQLKPVIEANLVEHGVLQHTDDGIRVMRTPILEEEIQMMDMYRNLSQSPEGAFMDVTDLIKTKQAIKPNFGKPWTTGDHLKASLSEDLSLIINERVPGLAKLNKEYAPFLQWKREAIKTFKPFDKAARKTQGITALSDISGAKEMGLRESRFISDTEKFMNKELTDKFTKFKRIRSNIQQQQKDLPINFANNQEEVRLAAEQFNAVVNDEVTIKIQELRNAKTSKIFDIEAEAQVVIDRLKKNRIVFGVAATAGLATVFPTLKKYIVHKFKYGLVGLAQ